MLPDPSGREMHRGNCLNYTMGDVVTHFRRRERLDACCARWAGRLRPPGRERRHPRGRTSARDHRAEHRRRCARRCNDSAGSSTGTARSPRTGRTPTAGTRRLFLRFFERGLAYRKEAPVNWCPEGSDGRCERVRGRRAAASVAGRPSSCGTSTQWFFKVTAYADELLEYELPPDGGVARANEDDPAQRDWPERGRDAALPGWAARHRHRGVHDPAGHRVRRNLLRRRAGAPVRRGAPRARRRRSTRATPPDAASGGARRRPGEDRRLHRSPRDQSGHRRAAADLRRRLRADGLRHGRDHGRPRHTTSATGSSPRFSGCRSSR